MVESILKYLTNSEGYSYKHMLLILAVSCAVSLYIFIVYRITAKAAVYSKTYGMTVGGIGIVTTGIILAMQSSLAIALGMVGALSIVRFRTAIKDPLDLLFLFWAVGEGIICGSDLLGLALLMCAIMTLALLAFNHFPLKKAPFLLVISSRNQEIGMEVERVLGELDCSFRVKSKNISRRGTDMIVELRAKQPQSILDRVRALDGIEDITLLSHDGETRF
ncbi:MAG TPA: DUF4956 domain-containing protein [Eubacteriales bacterium]|nr:DUF4956 domain-containing protein [Eubacteriales bacterium]